MILAIATIMGGYILGVHALLHRGTVTFPAPAAVGMLLVCAGTPDIAREKPILAAVLFMAFFIMVLCGIFSKTKTERTLA